MLNTLIESIKQHSTVTIGGQSFKPVGKALYVTKGSPDAAYAKIFMEDHYALVISPQDELVYFGKDEGNIGGDLTGAEVFDYGGIRYVKVADDYQILIHLIFGDPVSTEGEVRFWDYECENDKGALISIGVVQRSGQRADIVARVLSPSDVVVTTPETSEQ